MFLPNVFTNGYKRMQSIDLIEANAYGTSKDLVSEKGEIKCNNIMKQYKEMINFETLQRKTKKIIIQIGRKFLIIHTKYY